jgi:hypothetical protein
VLVPPHSTHVHELFEHNSSSAASHRGSSESQVSKVSLARPPELKELVDLQPDCKLLETQGANVSYLNLMSEHT